MELTVPDHLLLPRCVILVRLALQRPTGILENKSPPFEEFHRSRSSKKQVTEPRRIRVGVLMIVMDRETSRYWMATASYSVWVNGRGPWSQPPGCLTNKRYQNFTIQVWANVYLNNYGVQADWALFGLCWKIRIRNWQSRCLLLNSAQENARTTEA